MKITLCGSTAFIDNMYKLKAELEKLGHEIMLPPDKVPGENGELIPAIEYYTHKKNSHQIHQSWIWQNHSQRIVDHFEKVAKADAVLIANYDKNGVANYIGPNTLMEMGVAFFLKKPIYLGLTHRRFLGGQSPSHKKRLRPISSLFCLSVFISVTRLRLQKSSENASNLAQCVSPTIF